LCGVGESTLGTLASSSETTKGTGIAGDVLEKLAAELAPWRYSTYSTYLLGLAGELLLEVIEEVCVEILPAQVGAEESQWLSKHIQIVPDLLSSSGLDGEDTALDVKEGNIESSTTEIVDEDVPLLLGLAGAETVGDSGGGRLVDDTEDVKTSDGTGVLGGLTLVVVEVGGDGNDGLLNLLAELGLSNLLHLLCGSVNASRLLNRAKCVP
jgi:hypothetical protein